MNRESDRHNEKARKAFCRRRILKLEEVAELIHSSIHTARRRLREWRALTSYNKNGRYYALPDVPEFDAEGLWRWRGVFFSRHGNLRQTVVELVARSQAGLDSGELGSLLGLDPRSFLSGVAAQARITREKTRGRFVHYSDERCVCAEQRRRRERMEGRGRQPTPYEAVAILVEKLKAPALDNGKLSRRLKRQEIRVGAETIGNLFAKHGLAVKKTPPSA